MAADRGILGRIRVRGEEVLTQLSAELMSSPRFAKALEGAMRGREKLEQAGARALRQINLPKAAELRRAQARIEALEREVADLRRRVGKGAAGGSTTKARRPPPKRSTGKRKPGASSR